MRTCTYEGCDRPHYSVGLCNPHYQQQRRGSELSPIRALVPNPVINGRKVCSLCGKDKPVSDYYRRSTGILRSACKPCYIKDNNARTKARKQAQEAQNAP